METNLKLLSNEKPPVYKAKHGYLSKKKRERLRYDQKVMLIKPKRTASNKSKQNLKYDRSHKAIHDAVKQLKDKIIKKEESYIISKENSQSPNTYFNSRQTSVNDTFTDQTFDYGFNDSKNFSKMIGQGSRESSHHKSRQNGSSRYFDSILKRFQKPNSTIKNQNKPFKKKLSCFTEKMNQKPIDSNLEIKPLKFTDELKNKLALKYNKNGLKSSVKVIQKENISYNSKFDTFNDKPNVQINKNVLLKNSFSKNTYNAHQVTSKKQK